MRILQIITRSDLGGAQSVVINLANALSERHEVIVAVGGGDGKMYQMLSENVKQEFIPSLQRELSPWKEVQTIRAFRALYKKYKPDVIHLHSSKVGLLGRIAFPKGKTIYTVHGFDSIRIAYRKFLPLEKIFQSRCSAIIGVSEYDKKNLLAEGINNQVSVIYNGIASPVPLKDNPFLGLRKYSKVILCIARLSPPKDWHLFIQVASMLPGYAFVWIGNQHEYTEPHPENVFFLGSLPNAGAYNEYADLFMLPSNYEGLPMTIIEAMSFGKPVVSSDVGGISEIVENGVNGYVVSNEAELFCEKIRMILEDDDTYRTFSTNALKYYRDKLTVEKMVSGYMEIYQDIVRRNT